MSTPGDADLERGEGALTVPTNPFAPPSTSPKPTSPPNKTQHQSSNLPINRKSHPSQPTTHRRQSQHRPLSKPLNLHDPAAIPPKLHKLRTIIGISTPSSLLPPSSSSKNPFSTRPAPNLGIYTRIIHEESSARRQFYFAASVINTCYFGQICIAAALTALGASGSSNIAITVLGAANTVLAGVLTYLKGQGLPNRLRMYWTGLRKCREFIEEKERECAAEGLWGGGEAGSGGEEMDVDECIETIVKMYHEVRQNAEDNTPDTYLPMRGSSARGGGAGTAEKHTASIRYPEEEDDDDTDDEEDNGRPDNDLQDANGYIGPKSPTSAQGATTPVGGEGIVDVEEHAGVSLGGVLGNGAVKGGVGK
ncbi:MAG: hypothetical protein Q9178_007027 [Gyalolechia marmorata]